MVSTVEKKKKIFGVRAWPYWIVISMLWLIVQLPYRWFMRFGQAMGYGVSFIPHFNRTTTLINLQCCFPEKTKRERIKLMRQCYASLVMAMFETVFSCFAPEKRLEKLLHLQVDNLDHVAKEHGVLIIVPHYHVLDIVGRLYAMQTTHLSAVYRPHRKPVLEYINRKCRGKNFEFLVPRTQGKAMIRILRNKGKLLFLPDIDVGRKQSIFAQFFGISTASVASVPKLVALGDAKVVFAHAYRRADLTGYELSFSEPLRDYPSENIVHDVERVNLEMEKLIREHPEQYLWQYRRFRTRPEGEEDIYPKKRKFAKKEAREMKKLQKAVKAKV